MRPASKSVAAHAIYANPNGGHQPCSERPQRGHDSTPEEEGPILRLAGSEGKQKRLQLARGGEQRLPVSPPLYDGKH